MFFSFTFYFPLVFSSFVFGIRYACFDKLRNIYRSATKCERKREAGEPRDSAQKNELLRYDDAGYLY